MVIFTSLVERYLDERGFTFSEFDHPVMSYSVGYWRQHLLMLSPQKLRKIGDAIKRNLFRILKIQEKLAGWYISHPE